MSFDDPDCPAEILIASVPIGLFHSAMNLVYSQTLRKFPDLKIALSEGGIGWIPYFLERADYTYQHHRHWTHQSFGDKLPSDVFREHIIVCFIDDLAGVRNRDLIGVDTITWECDYPHSDSTWPNAPERLWEALAGVSDDEINKITHRNAMRHFQYDPFAHRPRAQCTVAALRAEATGVDLSLKRGSGGIPPSAYEHGFVTVGDLLKQLSTTYATPAEDAGPGDVRRRGRGASRGPGEEPARRAAGQRWRRPGRAVMKDGAAPGPLQVGVALGRRWGRGTRSGEVSISGRAMPPASTSRFHAWCSPSRATNSGITSAAKSSRLAQMSSCVLRPA